MTVRDVRVTRQPNGVIMKHSTGKSTLFEPIILPRQSETSSHCVQEDSADVSWSTWRPFCSKHGCVTRMSCDLLPGKSQMEVHLQKRSVVIVDRVTRQVEHLNSLVRNVSSLSMCHNNMQYPISHLQSTATP